MLKSHVSARYDWNDIVHFLELARTGSLVRAGRNLKVDHSTVGRRIRELERKLNCTLFKRSKSGYALTEVGLRLIRYAEGMENQASLIAEAVGFENSDSRGPVRVASMEGFGSLYLSRCISDFSKAYPLVQVELLTDTRMLNFDRREADVFVSFFRPQGKRILNKKIGEFKISLFASNKYCDHHPYPNTIKELEQHTFIDFIDDHIHVKENRWLSDILRPKRIIFRSTSLMAQYISASEGQGIVMLPSFAAAYSTDLRPIMPQLFTVRDIWLAVHEDLLHISRIKLLTAFLTKRVEQDRLFLMTTTVRAREP